MPKPGPTDTVPALLTPGEHVMNREAVALLGAENLAKANREGLKMRHQNVQGYQYGGEVQPSGIYRSGSSFSDKPSQFGTQLNLSSAPTFSTPEAPNVNNMAKEMMGDNGSQAAIGAAVKPVYQDPSDLVPTGSTGFNAPIKNNLLQGFSCGTTDSAGVKKGIFAAQDRLLREKMISNSQPSQVGNIGFLENTDLQGFANGGEVEGEGFIARPNYPGTIPPEKSLAAPKATGLAPTGQGAIPSVKEPVSVTGEFFKTPTAQPDVNFTHGPSDGSTMAANRQMAITDQTVVRPAGKQMAVTDQPPQSVTEPPAPKVRALNPETMSPEAKAFQAGVNPSAGVRAANPGLLTRAAGLTSGLAKGALAGEALQAASNAAYNASEKSPFSNVVTAAKTFAMGDTENAKRQLFGLPAETAPPLTRAAINAAGKVGDAIGFQDSGAKKFIDSVATPAQAETAPQVEAVPTAKVAPQKNPARPQKTSPQPTGETLIPNDSNYANLGNGSYIKSGNTAGIKRVNAMVAAGGLSNPEKEARFARDAANTAAQTAKYGDGKPTQPSELDILQDIALNGGATGDMTPTQFGAAKRRQNAAKELLGIRAHAMQAKQNYDLQNKTLAQNAEAAKSSAIYDRQKDEADRELKKQELSQKTNNRTMVVPEPIDPNNPMLGTRGVIKTIDQNTGQEVVSPAVKKAQLEPIRQKYTALLNDSTKSEEYKEGLKQHIAQNYPDLVNEDEK